MDERARFFEDIILIRVSVYPPRTKEVFEFRIALGTPEAEEMCMPSPPPRMDDPLGMAAWKRRAEAGEQLARAISIQIADKILAACNPRWRAENAQMWSDPDGTGPDIRRPD